MEARARCRGESKVVSDRIAGACTITIAVLLAATGVRDSGVVGAVSQTATGDNSERNTETERLIFVATECSFRRLFPGSVSRFSI